MGHPAGGQNTSCSSSPVCCPLGSLAAPESPGWERGAALAVGSLGDASRCGGSAMALMRAQIGLTRLHVAVSPVCEHEWGCPPPRWHPQHRLTPREAPALFGVRAGVGFYLLDNEEVQRLPQRSLRPRGELHSLMELDGGTGSVVQTKFPKLLLLLQKRQTNLLPRFVPVCSIPIPGLPLPWSHHGLDNPFGSILAQTWNITALQGATSVQTATSHHLQHLLFPFFT